MSSPGFSDTNSTSIDSEEVRINTQNVNPQMRRGTLSNRITKSENDKSSSESYKSQNRDNKSDPGKKMDFGSMFDDDTVSEVFNEEEEKDDKKILPSPPKTLDKPKTETELTKMADKINKTIDELNKSKDFVKLTEVLNEGLDPEIITEEEYNKIAPFIIDHLTKLTDADGNKIFDNAHKAAEFLTRLRYKMKDGRKIKPRKHVEPDYTQGQQLLRISPQLERGKPLTINQDHIIYQW